MFQPHQFVFFFVCVCFYKGKCLYFNGKAGCQMKRSRHVSVFSLYFCCSWHEKIERTCLAKLFIFKYMKYMVSISLIRWYIKASTCIVNGNRLIRWIFYNLPIRCVLVELMVLDLWLLYIVFLMAQRYLDFRNE